MADRFPMQAEASAATAIVMTVNHSELRLSILFVSNTRGIISITREFIDQHRGSAVERLSIQEASSESTANDSIRVNRSALRING